MEKNLEEKGEESSEGGEKIYMYKNYFNYYN